MHQQLVLSSSGIVNKAVYHPEPLPSFGHELRHGEWICGI
jgi:hypothetical protein